MASYKVILSGHIVEVYEYERGLTKGIDNDWTISQDGGRKKKKGTVKERLNIGNGGQPLTGI